MVAEVESEEESRDSIESFPPPTKRGRVAMVMGDSKAYEQAKSAKIHQVVEMEKKRMKFAKELELQRMQFFMKTHMEISQLKHGRRTSRNASSHRHHHHRSNDNGNNKNNSDSDN
ncbi:hypothetical protein QYF36_003601 [Acer negundo]|nr:hypothetical protein QYF36_003601 [Acer negundo]